MQIFSQKRASRHIMPVSFRPLPGMGCRLNKPLASASNTRINIALLLGYYWVIIGLLSQQKGQLYTI